MTEKRIYRKGLRYHAAPPLEPVVLGGRDEMSAHAAAAGVPLCGDGCTRAAGHAEGGGGGNAKDHATHVDASEHGFIARAQWEGER